MAMENSGNHSQVLTPKRRINLADAMLVMAPRKKKFPPKNLTDFLDQKAWTPQCEWDVGDFRVSGYLFDQGVVYLYTREADEIFLQGTTPNIRFYAKDWDHFRNKVSNSKRSVCNTMEWIDAWRDLSCGNRFGCLRT